jgi:hypothetical protein
LIEYAELHQATLIAVIARSEATKQSIGRQRKSWIASLRSQ